MRNAKREIEGAKGLSRNWGKEGGSEPTNQNKGGMKKTYGLQN